MSSETEFECPKRLPLYPDLSNAQQTFCVAAAFAFVGIMTVSFLQLYNVLDSKNLKWWPILKRTWPLLGIFPFVVSGYQFHFVDSNEFLCITPPNGTWGWWYLPVSEEFQLLATGYAEILGGLCLAVCGLLDDGKYSWARPLRQQAALCLFVMTIGMTFANVFMLTHGVWAYEMDEAFPVAFHLVRYTVQGLWLSMLWYMATRGALSDGPRTKQD